jgi:hypothetical protein
MTLAEARRAALRDLGGLAQTVEVVRDVRTVWLDTVSGDVRHAVRRFRREPRFVAAAVLTLAGEDREGVCASSRPVPPRTATTANSA